MKPAALAVLLSVLGCAGPRNYYVVEYQASSQSVGSTETQFPDNAALSALAKARTVAFSPPSDCMSTGSGADIARQDCGEVISWLEDVAAEAGFEVVSWQALRGSEPPLTYAKQNKVDLLFEINRLGPDDATDPSQQSRDLRFSRVTSSGKVSPLEVERAVQLRCRGEVEGYLAATGGGGSLLLDLKMVSVKGGRTLWNYRRLFTPSLFDESSSRLYYRVSYPRRWARILGIVLMIAGGASTISGLSTGATPAITSGLLVGGAGLGFFLYGRAGKGTPANDLCNGKVVADPFAVATTTYAPSETEKSSSAHFAGTAPGTASSNSLPRRLSRLAVRDFIEALAYLQALAPSPPKRALTKPKRPADDPSDNCSLFTGFAGEMGDSVENLESSTKTICANEKKRRDKRKKKAKKGTGQKSEPFEPVM